MKRNLSLLVASLIVSALLLELGVRVVFGFLAGSDAFFYGFVQNRVERNIAAHENLVQGRYSKYFPHQIKVDTDESGEPFEVKLNNAGFRGPDFKTDKKEGVFRIVTLGASSTFGYHARDNQTYPRYLEEALNELCSFEVEVINLGIPHLDAAQILALFITEGANLDPDIVTFYEGYNDSSGGEWRKPVEKSYFQRFRTYLRKKSLTLSFIKKLLQTESSFDKRQLEKDASDKSVRFIENLSALRIEVEKTGATFMVATQLAKSSLFTSENIAGISYYEEVELIREQLARDGFILETERVMSTHSALMEDLKDWSSDEGIALIDVIERIGDRRDELLSWVHLTPEGNRLVADEFASVISSNKCKLN
jgi:lysophospholipase L1-like esterase